MNRLKELIDSLNMSAEEFAKMFSVHRSSVYRYTGANKKEPREIPMDLAIRVCEKFNISLDWLVGKAGPKYRDNTVNALAEIYNGLSEEGKKELFSFAVFIKGRESSNEDKL